MISAVEAKVPEVKPLDSVSGLASRYLAAHRRRPEVFLLVDFGPIEDQAVFMKRYFQSHYQTTGGIVA